MALNALTLPATQGLIDRPFKQLVGGLTAGSERRVSSGFAGGFYMQGGYLCNDSLELNTQGVSITETTLTESRTTDLVVTAKREFAVKAEAELAAGTALSQFRVYPKADANGVSWEYAYETPVGATVKANAQGGTPTPSLPTFAFEPETTAAIAAMTAAGSTPTMTRQKTINRLVKRLKAGGFYAKNPLFLFIRANTEAAFMVNLFNPTKNLTKFGAPAYTPDVGATSSAATAYYDTGVPLSAINANSHAFGVIGSNVTAATQSDFGAVDGASNGISINCQNTSNVMVARSMGAAVSLGASTQWGLPGVHAVSRNAADTFAANAHGITQVTASSASAAIASSVTLTLLKVNGQTGSSGKNIGGCYGFNQGLSEAEMRSLHAIITDYMESVRYGDLDEYEPGFQPANVATTMLIYGATAQGVVAAREAVRQGKNVIIVGGWRERVVGGMSSGGLSWVDIDNTASIGGLARLMVRRANETVGSTATKFSFEPRGFTRACLQMLDPTKADGAARPDGAPIPIYWSDGVKSVTTVGGRQVSMTTHDGRTFTFDQWQDRSFEGDFLAAAGVPFAIGREAKGINAEASNGFLGPLSTINAVPNPSPDVSPYIVAGDPASGLLPLVEPNPGTAIGAADDRTQAYNFRLTWTTDPRRRIPFSSSPPPNYNKLNYEILLRHLANNPTLTLDDVIKPETIGTNLFDMNAKGVLSIDMPGSGNAYIAAASNAARETVWKSVENYIRGFIYLLAYDPDPRVPTAIRNAILTRGWDAFSYVRTHPNDEPFFPTQLYVREFRRMLGVLVWNGRDLSATDGTTPRSTNTVSTASYALDSHMQTMMLDTSTTPHRVRSEGSFFDPNSDGADNISPLPIEIFLPPKTASENGSVCFCASTTHVAFSEIRMELPTMQSAQSLTIAQAIAIESGNIPVQDVPYSAIRARLLASPSLTNETAPVLPQVN